MFIWSITLQAVREPSELTNDNKGSQQYLKREGDKVLLIRHLKCCSITKVSVNTSQKSHLAICLLVSPKVLLIHFYGYISAPLRVMKGFCSGSKVVHSTVWCHSPVLYSSTVSLILFPLTFLWYMLCLSKESHCL